MIFKDEFNEQKLLSKIEKSRNREFYAFNKYDSSFVGKWSDRIMCENDIQVNRDTISKNLANNNDSSRNNYLFYFFKDVPEELRYEIKDVI